LYEPLHHKYRPQTFAQLVGQGAIASTLINALQQNRIAPAYLFCGPRGTGKTSSARILAKSLNCLQSPAPTPQPCGVCDVCQSVTRGNALDIVEIDAASNTGVDNIRELIERSQFAPVQCRYKVYVIDECHMLSTAAFNALLKTLEEPPDRVVFVLATTDPQRVLPTIISRCQRFDFRRIPLPAMIKHLSYIAAQESIQIADPAVQLVAQISQGGLRDAESLLDQLSLQADEISVEAVWDLVGAVPERDLLNLVRAIAADDGTALLDRTRHLMDKGREPLIVLQSLVGFYRDLLIAKTAPARVDMVAITPPTWAEMTDFAQTLSAAQMLASQQKLQLAEVQIKNTTQPRLWLEITLTGLLPSALGAIAQLAENGTGHAGTGPARSVLSVANPPAISTQPPVHLPVQPPVHLPVQPPVQPTVQPTAQTPVSAETSTPTPTPTTAPLPSKPLPIGSSFQPAKEAVKETVAEAAEATEEVAEVAFGTLDELWAKILAALAPRGTQMLMSQQGMLKSFDGVGATVGFRSAKLQQMGRERVPNLEAAFETVFQRRIKVSLEVLKAETSDGEKTEQGASSVRSVLPKKDSKPSAPISTPASTSNNSTPNRTLPNQRPSNPSQNPPHQQPVSAPQNNLETKNSAANRSIRDENSDEFRLPDASSAKPFPDSATTVSLPSAASSGLPADLSADQWVRNQDEENIKRFAQFFNGQIVNLDDIEELSGQLSQKTSKEKTKRNNNKSSASKSSDPGPDVPF